MTSGTTATTADIPDTTNRRYVTDAELAFLTEQVDLFDGDGNIVLTEPGSGLILTSPDGGEYHFSVNDNGMLIDMSGFVTVENGQFMVHGRPWRGIGFNYFGLAWSDKDSIVNILDYIAKIGGNELRFWLFSQLNPTDSPGNFHFLDYPLDDPELLDAVATVDFEGGTTGWTLDSDWSHSTEDAHTGTGSIKLVSAGGFEGIISDIVTGLTTDTLYTFTLYYKNVAQSGFGPLLSIRKGSDGTQLLDGGLMEQEGDPDVDDGWVRKQVQFSTGTETSIYIRLLNFGGTCTYYFDDFWLNAQGTPILSMREAQFRTLDFAVDEARKRGIRLVPSFADNTTNYNSKLTFVKWANAVSGAGATASFPYIGFFSNSVVKQTYKDVMSDFLNRTNTINGLLYKHDPTFKVWELGNELRADRADPSGVNTLSSANLTLISKPGGWADEMSTYLKETEGVLQLVTYGSMSHEWEYRDGDSIYNGTYYGVSAKLLAELPYIDYLDFHLYPTQDAQSTLLYPLGEKDIVSYGQYVLGSSVRPAPIRAQFSSTTNVVATLNEASAEDDLFVIHVTFDSTPGSTPVVTDSAGNTYTHTSTTSSNRHYHYSGPQVTGGATTITATWTGSRTGSLYVDENSGRENKNNGRSRAGLEAQLLDWLRIGWENGKPCVISEHGYSIDINDRLNVHYPLQPRVGAIDALAELWFENGGAQIDLWAAAITGGSSYSINLGDRDGEDVTDNSNDTNLNKVIRNYNLELLGHKIRSEWEIDTRYAQSELTPRTFDGDYQGITQWGTSGVSVTYGDLLYLDDADGTWKLADANLGETYDKKLGMATRTTGANESIKVLIFGVIRADSAFPTFTPGKPVFMSETAGDVSNSKPTTSGAAHRIVGFADTADTLSFQPDGHFSYVS